MNYRKVFLLFLLSGSQLMLYPSCGESSSPITDEESSDSGNDDSNKDKSDVATVYITTANRSYDLKQATVAIEKGSSMSPEVITLTPEVTYQEMDGFGAAITGSTCFNLSQMAEADRNKFLEETFSPDKGYGFSYVRISIGCSDFSLSEYTCCDKEGIENFALTSEETQYIIPTLKAIKVLNPELKIIAAPWTCPLWMKVNNLTEKKPYNNWKSGQLNPDYYKDYAIYFAKWLQAFKDAGVPVYAFTPQNEPLNRGNSASLYMGWEEQRNFVKVLGPTLADAGLGDVKIYAFDHNYNYDNKADQQGYPMKIYGDGDAGKYLSGAAYHDYCDSKFRSELNNVHTTYPAKELVFTETSIGKWNNGNDLTKALIRDMNNVALGTVNNWCRGVIVWNLMLDSDGAPYRPGGCSTCYGAVDLSVYDNKTITRNSHYYIIAHLAAVVKPGARRIGNSGTPASGITFATFRNPDSSYALVASNSNTTDTSLVINMGGRKLSFQMPPRSVVSFKWK